MLRVLAVGLPLRLRWPLVRLRLERCQSTSRYRQSTHRRAFSRVGTTDLWAPVHIQSGSGVIWRLALTCNQSVVSAFMSMTYSQLAKLSLNDLSESLRRRRLSTFAWSASASSTSSAITGSMKPSPCGAFVFCSERESANKDPCDTRRSGVRWGVAIVETLIYRVAETRSVGVKF